MIDLDHLRFVCAREARFEHARAIVHDKGLKQRCSHCLTLLPNQVRL